MTQQCTATAKSTGERCENPPIKGGTVCHQHGGAAPQVKEKAQERLNQMADEVTADMQSIAQDLASEYEDADQEEKLAIEQALESIWVMVLDRTGHGPSEKREVEMDADVDHTGGVTADFIAFTEGDDVDE